MMRRLSTLVFALALACAALVVRPAGAQMGTPAPAPTAAPAPSASESAFLAKIMRDLPQRYPNPPAAIRAGYGVGFIQRGIARRDPDLVAILPDQIAFTLEMWLALHEGLRANRRLRLMMDHLATGLAEYAARSQP